VLVTESCENRTPTAFWTPRGSRTDKVQIQGYFPEETRRRLKMLAVQRDRTLEDLLGEAIADLFTKHSA